MSDIKMGEAIALTKTLSSGSGCKSNKIKYVEKIEDNNWFLENVPLSKSDDQRQYFNVGYGKIEGTPYLGENDEPAIFEFSGLVGIYRFYEDEEGFDGFIIYCFNTLSSGYLDNWDDEWWVDKRTDETWGKEQHDIFVDLQMMNQIGQKITNTLSSGVAVGKFGNETLYAYPQNVTSVNGKTGAVSLTYTDVGAQRALTTGTGIWIYNGEIQVGYNSVYQELF